MRPHEDSMTIPNPPAARDPNTYPGAITCIVRDPVDPSSIEVQAWPLDRLTAAELEDALRFNPGIARIENGAETLVADVLDIAQARPDACYFWIIREAGVFPFLVATDGLGKILVAIRSIDGGEVEYTEQGTAHAGVER